MHPVLFHVGSVDIRAWGVMVSLGIILGTLVSLKLAKRVGMSGDLIMDYVLYVVIAGLLGARVWEVVFSWHNFVNDPVSALKFWSGGMSIQGAVAGGLLFTLWYIRRHGLNFWSFGDIVAPGLILGQAIGRIGCLLNGDAYGIPTKAWYGIVYSPGSPAYAMYGATPLVPAELMEGAGDLLIFGILLWLWKRKPYQGFLALTYFTLYSLLRFTLEFWRTDSLMVTQTLKAAQMTSVIVIIISAAIALYKLKNRTNAAAGKV